jgi:asparagine synthase (glutamine-hydrolysing)
MSVFFCGYWGADPPKEAERQFEAALTSLGLPFRRLGGESLALWCGPDRPRGFVALTCPEGAAAVAGELLWEGDCAGKGGGKELPRLITALAGNRPEELCRANGSFAAVVHDASAQRLWLAADSLGGRPLYFCETAGALFFSTILEILLRVPSIPRTFRFEAFIDREALYCPLGDQTFFHEIRVLRESEFLCRSAGGTRRGRYFDWSSIELEHLPLEQAAEECARALRAAVRDRAPAEDEPAQVVLSGGLDSRCVAALLHEAGARVRACTLRIEGSQDYGYARRFADALGIELLEADPKQDSFPLATGLDVVDLLSAAARPFLPGRIYTGDGGGETFGLLLLRPDMAALMRRSWREGLQAYASKRKFPLKVFRQRWREAAAKRPMEALEEAFAEYSRMPPEKALHLFVLTSDLRRHLHEFYEVAPGMGCDLTAPFYDRRVLLSVMRLGPPLEPYLEYRLYYEILNRLPAVCRLVPWQTYPGRTPCPVPDDGPRLKSQWELLKEGAPQRLRFFRRAVVKELLGSGLPAGYFHMPTVAAALLMSAAGLGDYSHVLRLVLALCHEHRRGGIRG